MVLGMSFGCLVFVLSLVMWGNCLLMSERESLEEFYNSTGGSSWFPSNWNLSADPCTWAGVTCIGFNSDFSVRSLSLPNNNLTGTLSDLQLPQLTVL